MRAYRRLLEWVTRFEIAASVLALAAICVLTLASLVARQFPSWSLLWAEEISLLLMKIMVFVGAAAMYATRTFIVVDGVYERLPARAQGVADVFGWLVIALFASVVAVEGLLTYPRQIEVRSYLLEWPKFYFTLPLIIGAVSIVLTAIYYLLACLRPSLRAGDIGSGNGLITVMGQGAGQVSGRDARIDDRS